MTLREQLLRQRQRQDGSAPQVLTQRWATPYVLCHGQPVALRAETLRLLRAERRRIEQHGLTRGDVHAPEN